MGIDYETIYPCLQKWACDSTGISAFWQNQKHGVARGADNNSHIELFLTLVETVGEDQQTYVDDGSGTLDECITGIRNITISAQAKTRSQTPNDIAPAYLESMRTSLRLNRFKDRFQDCGIGLVELGPIIPLDATFQDRWESIAEMDMVFAVASTESADKTTDVIDKALLTSDFIGEDGESLPAAYQMVDRQIPEEVP